jgi:ATP-dependent helicase HrpB
VNFALLDLPVTDRLEALKAALSEKGTTVLVAPPGAGKTTLVPLALLEAAWRGDGKIVLLEPRRLAARAAARRMAAVLDEEVGKTVGYRMRLDVKESAATKILVVTEGVFARMVLDDPELSGIAAVIFDEFHERSLDADFGLALALDVKSGLRSDLRLLVMSATLDGARVAKLLDGAPVIESLGRSFPVEVRHEDRRPDERIEDAMARTIQATLANETGSILAFLPGTREINRVGTLLAERLPPNVDVTPLYGALSPAEQDAAIRPSPQGRRKVVLATSVAETSITIDGVTCVIDSGLQRLPKFEPASGLTRLETVRVSKASAEQRAGRAGRTASGVGIRLWRREQMAALPDFTPPEILEADLSGMLLDAAAFGIRDIGQLKFLDAPPVPALNEARKLLEELNVLDSDGRLTPAGEAMRKIALPVRLSHMVVEAAKDGQALSAAELAVLLTERGLGGSDVDLEIRWTNFRRDRSPQANAARGLARQFAEYSGELKGEPTGAGYLLLNAYPDHIAKARGKPGQFLLANGRGAEIDPAHRLAAKPFLVIADMQGTAERQRILSAAEIDERDLPEIVGHRIESKTEITFDTAKRQLLQRRKSRLGAITLSEQMLPPPTGEEADAAMIEAVRTHGINLIELSGEAGPLRQRLEWLRKGLGEPWPDVSDEALLSRLEDWLRPWLNGVSSLSKLSEGSLASGLVALVPHDLQRKIETLAPTHFTAPTGSRIPIRYEKDDPVLAVRVQELFGLKDHPSIANGKVPLLLELLSPAHRPIQLTRDLPGFWRGSWKDVRSEMRGRYPKHVWPEDPASAAPTARAKPRGT